MRPYSYKSDLARYCLLYKYGGVYSDLSYLHIRPIAPRSGTRLVVFRDIPIHPAWAVSPGVLFAEPGNEVLGRAIERIVEHFKARYYGINPLEPTGPYMFGRVLAETADWRRIAFGDTQRLNAGPGRRGDIVKIMPKGEIVAIRNKTRDGNIKDLVARGGNDYNKLWRERRIWGEPVSTVVIKRVRARFEG